jgi:hypothetical protein
MSSSPDRSSAVYYIILQKTLPCTIIHTIIISYVTSSRHFLCYIQQALIYQKIKDSSLCLSISPSPLPTPCLLSLTRAQMHRFCISTYVWTLPTLSEQVRVGGREKKCKEWKGGREGRMDEGGRENSRSQARTHATRLAGTPLPLPTSLPPSVPPSHQPPSLNTRARTGSLPPLLPPNLTTYPTLALGNSYRALSRPTHRDRTAQTEPEPACLRQSIACVTLQKDCIDEG